MQAKRTVFVDKHALITGAARGIGRATAEALAAAHSRVTVVDIDEAEAKRVAEGIRARGGRAQAWRCDVASDEDVNELARATAKGFGLPDILINNAFFRQMSAGTIENIDIDRCKLAFDVNVLGNVRMHKAFLPYMVARGSGHIVDTASSLVIAPHPNARNILPYVLTKGAILGMAYGLYYALRERGLAYSVFCPGLTDTRPADEPVVALGKAAPASFASSVLLKGIGRGDFLISSEPDYEAKLVQLAERKLEPLPSDD